MLNMNQIAMEALELIALSYEVDAESGLPDYGYDLEGACIDSVASKYGVCSIELRDAVWAIEAEQAAADAGPYGYIK